MQTALLHLQLFHLYAKPAEQNSVELVKLYNTATTVLNVLKKLDETEDFTSYCFYYALHAILIATTALRRLISGRQIVDVAGNAESYFLVALELCTKASVVPLDLASKCAGVITSLWVSSRYLSDLDITYHHFL